MVKARNIPTDTMKVIKQINTQVFGGVQVLPPTAKTPQGNIVVCVEKEGPTHIYTGHNEATVTAVSIYDQSSYSTTEVCRTDAKNNRRVEQCGDETRGNQGDKTLAKGAYDRLLKLAKANKVNVVFFDDCHLPSLPDRLNANVLGKK